MAEEKKTEKAKIKCPGTRTMLDAPPEEVKCRKCGYETEIFADEPKIECPKCGADIFRHADEPKPPSCVEWCQFAEKCLGDVFDLSKIKKIGGQEREKGKEYLDNILKKMEMCKKEEK